MRMGQFAGPSEQYGVPLSFVHPPDNDFEKGRFTAVTLDPRLDLTKKQRRELQEEIDEFFALLKLAQRSVGGG